MSAGQAIYTRLTTHGGTAALISTRCYPAQLPQRPTLPAVVYQRISGTPQKGSTALRDARYQFSCWGSTYASAQSLAAQVRAALEEHTDATSKWTRVISEFDDFDPDSELHRVLIDAFLLLEE